MWNLRAMGREPKTRDPGKALDAMQESCHTRTCKNDAILGSTQVKH